MQHPQRPVPHAAGDNCTAHPTACCPANQEGLQPLELPTHQPCLAGSPRVPHSLQVCRGRCVTCSSNNGGSGQRLLSRTWSQSEAVFQSKLLLDKSKRDVSVREIHSLHGWRENTSQAMSGFLQQFEWLPGCETDMSPYRGARHCTCTASPSSTPGCCRKAGRQKHLGSGVTSTWFLNSLAILNADGVRLLGHKLCAASPSQST